MNMLPDDYPSVIVVIMTIAMIAIALALTFLGAMEYILGG